MPLTKENTIKQIRKTGDKEISFGQIEVSLGENLFVTVGELNSLRRAAIERYEEAY
jgi:hypothetical protein